MAKDIFNRKWIIENSIDVCSQYKYGVFDNNTGPKAEDWVVNSAQFDVQ